LTGIGDWVDAAVVATVAVAAQALEREASVLAGGEVGAPFDAPFGAYVPLSSSDSAVQFGIVAEFSDCEGLARILLGMGDGEPFESEGDVADAVGEIANMVAGAIKTRMNAEVPDIVLGLPLCVRGTIQAQGVEQVVTELGLGAMRMHVVVLRSSTHAAKVRSRPAL